MKYFAESCFLPSGDIERLRMQSAESEAEKQALRERIDQLMRAQQELESRSTSLQLTVDRLTLALAKTEEEEQAFKEKVNEQLFFFSLSQIFPIPLLLSTVIISKYSWTMKIISKVLISKPSYFEPPSHSFTISSWLRLIVVQFMIWVFAETYVKEAAFLLWCQAYQAERIYVRNNWNRFSSKSNKIIFWLLQWRGKRNT